MSLNGLAAFAPLDWFTPDAPRQLQGPPKPTPRPARPLKPEAPVGHGPFQCRYCKRYGQPGACAGCGAPNAPAPGRPVPDIPLGSVIRAGIITPNEARRYLDISTHDKPGQYLVVPAFPMVKR